MHQNCSDPLRRTPPVRSGLWGTVALLGLLGGVPGWGETGGALAPAGPRWQAEQVVVALEQLSTKNPDWSVVGPPMVSLAMPGQPPAVAPDGLGGQVAARWRVTAEIMGPGLPSPVLLEALGFPTPLDALGLFAASVHRNSLPAEYALAAYWTGNVLNIWRGEIYLRLQVAPDIPRTTLNALANNFLPLLPPDEAPLLWRLMPSSRLAPHTLERGCRPLKLLPGVRDCLRGEYRENGRRLVLILLEWPDAVAARRNLGVLIAALQPRRPPQPLATFEAETLLLHSAELGLCLVTCEDRYLAAILNIHDRDLAEGLLRVLGTHIRILPPRPAIP